MKLINPDMQEVTWENKSNNLSYDDHLNVQWYELKNTSGAVKTWHDKDYMPFKEGELLVTLGKSLYVYETIEDAYNNSNLFKFSMDYFASPFSMPNDNYWRKQNIYLMAPSAVFMYLDQIILRNERQKDIFDKYHLSGYATKHLIKVLAPKCRPVAEYFVNRDFWSTMGGKEQIGWIVANTADAKETIDKVR